jgi:hypothetical protein
LCRRRLAAAVVAPPAVFVSGGFRSGSFALPRGFGGPGGGMDVPGGGLPQGGFGGLAPPRGFGGLGGGMDVPGGGGLPQGGAGSLAPPRGFGGLGGGGVGPQGGGGAGSFGGAPVPPGGIAPQQPAGAGAPDNLPPIQGTQTMGALGISAEAYHAFRRGVTGIESRYGFVNRMGGAGGRYAGIYQMGPREIERAATALGEPTPSRGQFLADRAMQDRYMDAYTRLHHDYLMGHSAEYRAMGAEQRLQALGYAHNQGEGGAARWLRTGRAGADAWGTSGSAYSRAVGRELNRANRFDSSALKFRNSQHGECRGERPTDGRRSRAARHGCARRRRRRFR